jgi:curved DNA-binding protein CbpA
MFGKRDTGLYAVLGLGPGPHAISAVKSAFRQAIKREHPDLGGNADRARQIIETYDELKARGLAT